MFAQRRSLTHTFPNPKPNRPQNKQLAYAKPEAVDPGPSGAWNLRQVKLLNAAAITSWACLSLADESEVSLAAGHPQALATFLKELVDMAGACGMRVPPPVVVHFDRGFSVQEHVAYAVEQAEAKFKAK